jgi:exosome complex RNA-binding protein Rrp42 (RNase PH superfamily)
MEVIGYQKHFRNMLGGTRYDKRPFDEVRPLNIEAESYLVPMVHFSKGD